MKKNLPQSKSIKTSAPALGPVERSLWGPRVALAHRRAKNNKSLPETGARAPTKVTEFKDLVWPR